MADDSSFRYVRVLRPSEQRIETFTLMILRKVEFLHSLLPLQMLKRSSLQSQLVLRRRFVGDRGVIPLRAQGGE